MSKSKKNILSKPILRRKKLINITKRNSEINILNKEHLIKLYQNYAYIR